MYATDVRRTREREHDGHDGVIRGGLEPSIAIPPHFCSFCIMSWAVAITQAYTARDPACGRQPGSVSWDPAGRADGCQKIPNVGCPDGCRAWFPAGRPVSRNQPSLRASSMAKAAGRCGCRSRSQQPIRSLGGWVGSSRRDVWQRTLGARPRHDRFAARQAARNGV
jgi:hypothetical protein